MVATFETLPLLFNVFLFIVYIMLLFSILGVRAYQGSLARQCTLPIGVQAETACPSHASTAGRWS